MVLAAEVAVVPPKPSTRGGQPYREPGRGVGERRLVGLLYSGQRSAGEETIFVLRRLDLAGRPRVVWEITAPEPGVLAPERYGRIGDVVIISEWSGVAGIDVTSGAVRWRIPSPVRLGAPPRRFPDGMVRLVFTGGEWARWTDPATGAPLRMWIDPATGHVLPDAQAARREAEVTPDGAPGEPLITPGDYRVDGLLARRIVPSPGAQRITRLVDPDTGDVLATLPGDPEV